MAFNDTLFQLGMDLTRSSTAQKEDLVAAAPVAVNDRKDTFLARHDVKSSGTHLFVDLIGAEQLDNVGLVEQALRRGVEAAGSRLLHVHLHQVEPTGGVSGVAMLAQSRIGFHSWPSDGYAALDVHMAGDADPRALVRALKEAFRAEHVVVKEHLRGAEVARAHAPAAEIRTGSRCERPARVRQRRAA